MVYLFFQKESEHFVHENLKFVVLNKHIIPKNLGKKPLSKINHII